MTDWPPPLSSIVAMFDQRAPTYDASVMHQWLAAQTVKRLAVRQGCVALDVAAGTGLASREIAAQAQGQCTVVAVDVSREMLRMAPRFHMGAKVMPVVADGSALPFAHETFDIVACVSALAYFPDPVGAVKEWKRVLRLAGQLVFQVFEAGSFAMPRMLREATKANGLTLSDGNAPMGSRERCVDALRRAGFQEIEIHRETWSQQWGDPEGFWDYATSTWLRHVFEKLPPSHSIAIRTNFLDVYAREVGAAGQTENCNVLIAMAQS